MTAFVLACSAMRSGSQDALVAGGCLGTETLVEFLEGGADTARRARIEAHASRCTACREILSSLASSPAASPARPVSASSHRPLSRGAQVGRYVISHEVGRGGMGTVHGAYDPELGRMIAVKVLRGAGDHSMQARLRREAQAMARLAHPNVVAVHDVGAFDDRIFIAMEYIDGETLARWQLTPRPLRAVLDVFRAAGRGLAAAHAAGIVHRDFKPENVLIGRDGRVCVGDFGLARAASSGEPAQAPTLPVKRIEAQGSQPPDAGLTATGVLLGTPYYMAPELYEGAPANERSDQFSFCVALVTVLHGKRPVWTEQLDAAASAIRLRESLGAHRLPRRIRAALCRGLAVDPAARFASLDDLLTELAPRERSTRRVVAAGAVLLAGSLAVAWYGVHAAGKIDRRCTGAADAYAGTWSPARRAAIAAAFTGAHVPFAQTALDQVTAALDRYAARWIDAHTATCRATRILGEQAEATLDLRMRCLERRRQEAAALIGALATADAATVAQAVGAAARLTDVDSCADVAALEQVIPPPRDAAAAAALAALTPRLAEARAKLDTGAYAAGLVLVRPVAEAARTLGYRPFEAEAEYLQGQLEIQVGDRAHAEPTLQAAVLSAEAGRHDEIAARAQTALVSLVGKTKADYARAVALAPFAAAAIARLGGSADSAEIEAQLEGALGQAEYRRSKLDLAVPHLEKALAIEERAHGADHPGTAQAAHDLGLVALAQGNPARAAALFERARAIYERALGPDHPLVALELHALGNAHVDDGQIELAERDLRRALAIRETALGPDHPMVANNLSDLARALRAQRRREEALALDRRAVAVGARAFGPDHPSYAEQLLGLGRTLERMGQYAEATQQLHHAEAIFARLYGANHDTVLRVRTALAEIQTNQSHWQQAVEIYERLIPALERAQDIGDGLLGARINLACALLELHQPARALVAIQPLASQLDPQPPRVRGYVRFVVARALWDSGQDRTRARELLRTGRAELATAGAEATADLAEVDAWIKHHLASDSGGRAN